MSVEASMSGCEQVTSTYSRLYDQVAGTIVPELADNP